MLKVLRLYKKYFKCNPSEATQQARRNKHYYASAVGCKNTKPEPEKTFLAYVLGEFI